MRKSQIMNKRQQLEMTVQDHLGFINLLQEARAKKLLSRFDLNPSQFTLLFLLGTDLEEEWTISMLTKHLEMNMPGISKIVKALSERGYLKIMPGNDDKRQKVVSLTKKGSNKRATTLAATAPFVTTTFTDWNNKQLEEFCHHLEKLKHWLDENRDIS